MRRDPGKRIRKQFTQDYRFVLTSAQAEALLDVLDTLISHHRYDARTRTHVWDPASVRTTMSLRALELGEKVLELRELTHAASPHSDSPLRAKSIPVVVDPVPRPDAGVSLSHQELRAIDVFPGADFSWIPANRRQLDQWDAHFSLMFNKVGALYLNLGRERLRMAAGKPTLCKLCNQAVLPPSGGIHATLGGESAIPVLASLCLNCIKRELGKRADEWDRMSDGRRMETFLPRLQELGRRGRLP